MHGSTVRITKFQVVTIRFLVHYRKYAAGCNESLIATRRNECTPRRTRQNMQLTQPECHANGPGLLSKQCIKKKRLAQR